MGADRRVLCLALCALQLVSQLAHGARPAVSYTDGVGPRLQRIGAAVGADVPAEMRIPSEAELMDGRPGRQYVGGTRHWHDPVVHTWENFVTAAECGKLVALAKDHMRRGTVTGEKKGHESAGRTNDVTFLPHDYDDVVWEVVGRISRLVGLPPSTTESLQIIHYEAGERYNKHWDAYDHHTDKGTQIMKDGGNRVLTALFYLTDVVDGGETELVNLGLRVNPAAGRLLVFHDVYNGSATKHPDSYHAGLPPGPGSTKWAANLWFHEADTSAGTMGVQSRLYKQGKGKPSARDLLRHIGHSDPAAAMAARAARGEGLARGESVIQWQS